MTFVFGWMLPWLTGVTVWVALVGLPRRAFEWCTALGYGFMFGCLLIAVSVGLLAQTDSAHALPGVSLALSAVLLAAFAAVVWRWRRRERSAIVSFKAPAPLFLFLWVLLLIALIVRGIFLIDEILMRPLFPWDAWAAWAVRSKTWYLAGQQVPFTALQTWQAAGADAHALSTHAYPPFVPLLQLWSANAAGAWRESLIALPWIGAACALLFGVYGQLRSLGLGPLAAILAVYAIGSLPLLNTHVVLAGYADLWVAALLSLALLAGLNGIRHRQRGQLAAAVLLGACLPLVKLDGAVWLFLMILIGVGIAIPRSWRWPVGAGLLLIAAVSIVFGQLAVPLPGLGWVRMSWGEIVVPGLGVLSLHWRPVAAQMIESLWLLPNWHLLFYLLPLAPFIGWRTLRAERGAAALAWFLLAAFAFLFGLFFFTDAAAWAENYTSVNRLILHVAPLSVVLIALLLAPGRERAWKVAGRPVRQWVWDS